MKKKGIEEALRNGRDAFESTESTILCSRRDILRGGIGVGVVASTGGLAMNLASPGTAEGAARKLPTKWDETYDIVVVGSGFAGLAAAAEAAKAGAKVLILEKMPVYGGNSIISSGSYVAWTDKYNLREKLGLGNDSPELHIEDTLKGGDYYGDPKLVEIMVKGAPDALNWMIDEGGLKIRQVLSGGGGHSAFRVHISEDSSGAAFCEALKKIGEKYKTTMRLGAKVTWIWRADQEGPVLGVEVEKGKKKQNIAVKKGLVIASGGFGRDIKMRQAYNPSVVPEYNSTNQPGATGEMIRYAQAIGADTIQLNFVQLYPFGEAETGLLDPYQAYATRVGFGPIYVNKLGKRYVSELERRDVCARAQMKMGLKPTYVIMNYKQMVKVGGEKDLETGVAKGRFIKGDTIEELGRKLNIPVPDLVETVNNYNRNMKEGKDPEFNKRINKDMLPLDEGPFFALTAWPAVHFCCGGLRIDVSARVIDIWDKPIPRLFACGEVAGGVMGSNRLNGNAYPSCTVFGRVAGTSAAKEKA